MALNLGELSITAGSFEHGGRIPDRHARSHDDLAPPLSWGPVPAGTAELVLLCHDPDAPLTDGFTHWVVYGIPPEVTELAEGDNTAHIQGETSFGERSYGGPAPPPGHGDHHYYFQLYAVGTPLDAEPGLTRRQVLERIDGSILEQARVVGTYSR